MCEPEVNTDNNPSYFDSHISDTHDSDPGDLLIAFRKGGKILCQVPYLIFLKLFLLNIRVLLQLLTMRILASLQEAPRDVNWVKIMDEEIKALERNGTWEIVKKLGGKKLVGCR